MTEREALIKAYKEESPIKIFKLSEPDVKVVAELIEFIPMEVVNVLIDFILRKYDWKFPRSIALKIGSHWSRIGIETVEQAMEQAIKEHSRKEKPKSNISPEHWNMVEEIIKEFGYQSKAEALEKCIESVYQSFIKKGEAVTK